MYYTPEKLYEVIDPSFNSSQQQIDVTGTDVMLTDLYPATNYHVYVTAFNEAGEGNKSLTVTEETVPACKTLHAVVLHA